MQTIEHILRVDSSGNKIFGQIRSNISLWQTIWVVPYQGVTPCPYQLYNLKDKTGDINHKSATHSSAGHFWK